MALAGGFSEALCALHPVQSQHPPPEMLNVPWNQFWMATGLEGHWALSPGGSCTVSLKIRTCLTATTAAPLALGNTQFPTSVLSGVSACFCCRSFHRNAPQLFSKPHCCQSTQHYVMCVQTIQWEGHIAKEKLEQECEGAAYLVACGQLGICFCASKG